MALIKWADNLSVNVAEIDRQHKVLITMINNLHSAMQQGVGKTSIGAILDGLTEYAATHFKTEEAYFDRYQYPETNSHKKEHAAFVERVLEFKADFEKGKMTISIQVITFLSDWLKKHIMVKDQAYSRFFNEQGLR